MASKTSPAEPDVTVICMSDFARRLAARKAERFDEISYSRVLNDNLKVMDATAVALCRENSIPIVVFSIRERGNVAKVIAGEGVQTIVREDS